MISSCQYDSVGVEQDDDDMGKCRQVDSKKRNTKG